MNFMKPSVSGRIIRSLHLKEWRKSSNPAKTEIWHAKNDKLQNPLNPVISIGLKDFLLFYCQTRDYTTNFNRWQIQQTKRYRNFLVLCKKRAGPPCLLLKGTVLLFFRVFTIRYCFCRSFRSGSFRFSCGYFSPHSAFFDYFSFLIPPLFPILRCFLWEYVRKIEEFDVPYKQLMVR